MTVFDLDIGDRDFQRAAHFIAVKAYVVFKIQFSARGGEKLSLALEPVGADLFNGFKIELYHFELFGVRFISLPSSRSVLHTNP